MGVCVKISLSILSDFLSQEQLKENKMTNLTKLQYLNDKKYHNLENEIRATGFLKWTDFTKKSTVNQCRADYCIVSSLKHKNTQPLYILPG